MRLAKRAGLMVAAMVLGSAAATGGPSMTIRVLDQAHLPEATIHKMENYIANTMRNAGIEVKWVECSVNLEACKRQRGPNEFWLRIIAEIPAAAGVDQMGFTQRGEAGGGIQCINVIYPVVQRLLTSGKADESQVLGAAAVHEIGHLYLGSNVQAHSLNGVMCGFWSWREIELAGRGELNFSRDQAQRIRNAMDAVGEI